MKHASLTTVVLSLIVCAAGLSARAAGGAAGGHLAAFTSMVDGMDDPADDLKVSPKANRLVLFTPVFDNGSEGGYGAARIGDRFKEFSPAHNITSNAPPTVVFLGSRNNLISLAVLERFKANMTKASVRCDTHVYKGQPYGFFNQYPYKTATLMEVDSFLASFGWLKGEMTLTRPATDAGRGKELAKLALTNLHGSLVSKGFVLGEADWHIWCNAPILDDRGKLHIFVSRWPVKDTFGLGWHTSCEIAHYTSDKPEGPYTYVSTVLKGSGIDGSWRKHGTHNVTVVRLPDHRYAMFFIANSNGTVGFPANQKIGMMLASSLDGPWKFAGQDGLVLDAPTDPAIWSYGSAVGVNNPTLLPMPDGRFLLYYKAMKPGKGEVRRMGVAIADKAEGPYRFEKESLTTNEGTIEDGFAFHLNGEVCLLVTDCHGPDAGGGMIYHAQDGIHFDQKPVRAYEAVDHYLKRWPKPVKAWRPWVLERPALLLDQSGTPTHLFAPCGTPPEGKQGTATFLFEIQPGK